MFAVLKTGGKQYKVKSGDTLKVEKLAADEGDKVQFNDVMMIGGDAPVVGAPMVADAAVQAEVLGQIKGPKVINFVKRRRKHSSKRTKGHRQNLTLVRITEILTSGAGASGVMAAVGGSKATPALSAPAAKPAPAPKAKAKPKPDAAPSAAAARPANLLTEARGGTPDDLKKISGVGPKLEGLLHQNGVFHFDQITAWTSEEIAFMDDQLSFKGRIERDEWQKQAAAFAAEQE